MKDVFLHSVSPEIDMKVLFFLINYKELPICEKKWLQGIINCRWMIVKREINVLD